MVTPKKNVKKSTNLPIPDNRAAGEALSPAMRDLAELLADIAVKRLADTFDVPATDRGQEKHDV